MRGFGRGELWKKMKKRFFFLLHFHFSFCISKTTR
jgi:hypothetical protein